MQRRFAVIALVASLAACGGGGGGSIPGAGPSGPVASSTPSPKGTSVPTASANTAPATFTVIVPAKSGSSSSRSAQYIPANTAAIKFTLMQNNGAATSASPQTFALSAQQPYCQTVTAGLSCSLQVDAPLGSDVYLAETYSDASATAKLGSGVVAMSVVQNARNTASLTLTGTVATVILTSASSSYNYLSAAAAAYGSGTSPSSRIYLVALDAQGNQILAPATFNAPVMLQTTLGYSYQYGYARGRQPMNNPTPTPSPDPASFATLQVAYAAGGTASTALGTPQVAVNSPGDIVSIVPATGVTTYQSLYVSASVGSTVQGTTINYQVRPDQCQAGYTGSVPNCIAPSPTPTPVPTPCPAGYYPVPYCYAYATIYISSSDPRYNVSYNRVEFRTPSDPPVTLTASVNDGGSFAGPVTLAEYTAGSCSGIAQPLAAGTPVPFPAATTAAAGSATFTIAPSGTNGSCTVQASASTLGVTINSAFGISVNSVTGVIK